MTSSYDREPFFDAKTARNIAIGGAAKSNTVLLEIQTIQNRILNDANLRKLEFEDNGVYGIITPFTSNIDVFHAWLDVNAYQDAVHRVARAQMNDIINYFTKLGYTIRRERDGINNQFRWIVEW